MSKSKVEWIPGHDGNPPHFVPARGSEVTDPKTGKVIREAVLGLQNINTDRLERMLDRGQIDRCQHAAGRKLQGDWQLAQIVSYGSVLGGHGGGGAIGLADAKCDAMKRVNDAVLFVRGMSRKLWPIIESVVIDNDTIAKAEKRCLLKKDSGTQQLCTALDVLARHYGLT